MLIWAFLTILDHFAFKNGQNDHFSKMIHGEFEFEVLKMYKKYFRILGEKIFVLEKRQIA